MFSLVLTSGTLSGSLNSMYAMPLNLLVLLHVINLTSLTLPTELKNSSRSLARILCDNCIQNTVRASLSSGLNSSNGDVRLYPKPIGDLVLRGNVSLTDGGDGLRLLSLLGLRLQKTFKLIFLFIGLSSYDHYLLYRRSV